MTRIFLLRHGRTSLNAAGLLRGHLDQELDELGLLQAGSAADVVGRYSLERVVTSPLQRAVQTAQAVAERAGLNVELDDRLIDRDYGPWAGRARDAVLAKWGSLDNAPEIETPAAVLQRSMDVLVAVSARVDNGAVVVVSHDAVNRLLLTTLDPRLGDVDRVPQDTGCFNVIERRDDLWTVVSVNNAPAGHEGPAAGS
jgi:broad specificity phosphatase PhoE